MALWSDKKEFIFNAVVEMYTDMASHPDTVFHFPTGRSACLFVGYPANQLDGLPAEATESFAGVGYPFAADVICPGDAVLDIGSGSGTDVLIAAMLTGTVSVMSVGSSAVVPNCAWAAQMVRMASTDGSLLNSTPPPPLTCRSMKPGTSRPPSRFTRSALAGTALLPTMPETWPNSTSRAASSCQ